VKPAPFEYVRPGSVEEALSVLAAHGGEAKALAGGQSLVPLMNLRLARPAVIVDLNGVEGLDHIGVVDGYLAIGSMVRHERLLTDPLVQREAPLLTAAAAWIGHGAIRTRGTVGGSLAHADPAAELPAVVTLLDAQLRVAGPKGERTLAAREFFTGPLSTALTDDELLVEVRIPAAAGRARFGFAELARRHGDFALVLAACTVKHDGAVTVALGGVGPAPVLVDGSGDGGIAEFARRCSVACDPGDDIHAPASYRRALAGTLAARALGQAMAMA
jgi:CO/xanthine dehydrogenase FAD-binding subunit